MTPVRFWYPERQYLNHKEEFDAAIQDVLTRGELILRKDVEDFEKSFAKYLGVKHVIGVASCTDALVISLKAAGMKTGDAVAAPSYTFRATIEAIVHAGGIPILYDMDGVIEPSPARFVIPAHLEGREMYPEAIEAVMIEDAAQAVGAVKLKGLAACYSFYPAKILGCFGDGGAIATNSDEFAEKVRKMRNHYKNFWNEGYGYNSRLDNLQAAVLNVKLKYLPDALHRRREIARMYDSALKDLVETPEPREVYQDYIVGTKHAAALQTYLQEKGIEAMLNEYPFPYGLRKKPLSVQYESRTLRLPCTPEHSDSEIEYVAEHVKAFFNQLHA